MPETWNNKEELLELLHENLLTDDEVNSIVENKIIVENIKKSIKSIEDLKEKDTIYNSHFMIYKEVLPYLKSLLPKTMESNQ